MAQRRWFWWAVFWGWWTVFGLLTAIPRFIGSAGSPTPLSWSMAATVSLLDLYSWAGVALAAAWLARRVPLEDSRWGTVVAVHLAGGLVVLALRFWGAHSLIHLAGWLPEMPPFRVFLSLLPWNLWMYLVLAGAAYGLGYYQRHREHELAAARLEAQLNGAELRVLKMQLHPHFLFNTLNAISALMHRDVEAADRMIARLGDLLRLALHSAGTQEVALRNELQFLETYLEIEQTRLGPRLSVRFDIEPDTYDAAVPHLILQPLVENAIRHGISPRAAPGWVEISARKAGERLQLQVRDSGPGLPEGPQLSRGNGVGLANVRARLAGLYGDQHEFEIGNAPAGGLAVSIVIPFRSESQSAQEIVREEPIENPDADRRRRAARPRAAPQAARGSA